MNALQKGSIIAISLLIGLFSITVLSAVPGQAKDIKFQDSFLDDEFEDAVRDLGTAFSYVPADPAESHSIIGFNVGVAASAVQLPDSNQYMNKAFSDTNAPGALFLPKIQMEKGLPFVEVGGFVAGDPNGNTRLYGGQVKYPLLEGSVITPAVSLRGHGTQLFGVDDFSLKTYGGDLSVSKGFDIPLLLGFTPYGGYSMFRIVGDYTGSNSILKNRLDKHETTESRIFAGARIAMPLFNVVGEIDVADEIKIYTLRLNFGF